MAPSIRLSRTETRVFHTGETLYRVIADEDIGPHNVAKGDRGGWASGMHHFVGDNVWVGGDATVRGHAQMDDAAAVGGVADISDRAFMYSNAYAGDCTAMSDTASAGGHARLADKAALGGDADISGHAFMYGNAFAGDSTVMSDNASAGGFSLLSDNAALEDGASITGHAVLRDNATVGGTARLSGFSVVGGDATVTDGRIGGRARLLGSAVVDTPAVLVGHAVVDCPYGYIFIGPVGHNRVTVTGADTADGGQVTFVADGKTTTLDIDDAREFAAAVDDKDKSAAFPNLTDAVELVVAWAASR